MKKRVFALGLSLGLVAAMAASAVANGTQTYTLYAGQNNDVGAVSISGGSPLSVTIDLNTGWCMTAAHGHAAANLGGFPLTNQDNPKVGQFEYSEKYANCRGSVSFPLSGPGPFVAVHAKVWDESNTATKTVFSNENTNVIAWMGNPVGPNPAVPAYEPVGYQDCGSYRLSPASGSVWDTQNGGAVSNDPGGPFDGAKCTWRTNNPAAPNAGEYVTFQRTLATAGPRVGGNIKITADNGYRVFANGTQIGNAQVGGSFPPNLNEANVKTSGWQSPETFSLPSGTGDINLKVIAANEKAWPNDVPNQQTTGTGGISGGVCPNPGGLIFKATLRFYADSESAWGANGVAGTRPFDGNNWATYMEYPQN